MANELDDDTFKIASSAALATLFKADNEEALEHALTAHPILLDERIDAVIGSFAIELPNLEARRFVEARRQLLADARASWSDDPVVLLNQALQVLQELECHGRGMLWAGFAAGVGLYGLALRQLLTPDLVNESLDLLVDAAGPITREAFLEDWATIHRSIGIGLRERQSGDQSENLERAIAVYEQALTALNRERKPHLWAALQVDLAEAYRDRLIGHRSENIERRIEAYQQSLTVLTREGHAHLWATVQTHLGNALRERIRGDRSVNLEQAIETYRKALAVWTFELSPRYWVTAKMNLGNAFLQRLAGDRSENLGHAIAAFEQVLKVWSPERNANGWAEAQMNLGYALTEWNDGDRSENLERAIAACKAALVVWTRARNADGWAKVQTVLGTALRFRLAGDRANNLELAIAAYGQALTVLTHETDADEWADVQQKLSTCLADRLSGDQSQNLEMSIAALEKALTVRTRERDAVRWAMVQNDLGAALTQRIAGTRSENLERAIAVLEEALTVLSRQTGTSWASVQMNLGVALSRRLVGDPAQNLELAIAALEDALELFNRYGDADEWARAQMNLGTMLRERLSGDRSQNLERAVAAYRAAQTVWTRERSVDDWALLQLNFGNALLDIAHDMPENWEQAITAFQEILRIWRREQSGSRWAVLQAGLGYAFLHRIAGDPSTNIERAIEAYREALTVPSHELNAADWAWAQINLGIALSRRISGHRPENLLLALNAYESAMSAMPAGTDDRRRLGGLIGSAHVLFEQREYGRAAARLSEALALREAMVHEFVTRESTRDLIQHTDDIGSMLAYCRIHSGEPKLGLEELERARGIETRRVLAFDIAHLSELDPDLRTTIDMARDRLRTLRHAFSKAATWTSASAGTAEIANEIRMTQTVLQSATKAAGVHGGMGGYLRVPDMLALVPDGGLLIVPVTTRAGGAVYFLPREETAISEKHVLNLPDLTVDALGRILSRWFAGYSAMMDRVARQLPGPGEAFQRALLQTIEELWQLLMGPALAFAQERGFLPPADGEIVILPTGPLSLLPLHAAWDGQSGRCVLDHCVVSYVPSFAALQSVRLRATQSERSGQDLLGVFNPQRDDPKHRLPLSEGFEWPYLQRCFGDQATALIGPAATLQALLEAAPRHSYLHLSCHGVFDWREPEKSGLLLADGERFDVRRIAGELRLPRCRMVAAAACETAITASGRLEAEQVGVPAAFIQAGAPAVLATLWPVTDRSTAQLMVRVYDLHICERLSPARALRQAVLELRDQRLVPSGSSAARAYRQAVPSEQDTSPDYAHSEGRRKDGSAFFWAAFILVGA